MKLYNNAAAPNARRVRMFLAEKGIEIEYVEVAFDKGDNQTPEFLALNSLGKVPVLQLDDGRALTESMSICRYLEEVHPDPALMGVDAYDRAHVDRWNRRMELEVFNIVANVGVHTIPFFKDRVQQIPEFAASQRTAAAGKFAWLDKEISDGRTFIAGDRFSVADITGMAAFGLAEALGIEVDGSLTHLHSWAERMRSRPSWKA